MPVVVVLENNVDSKSSRATTTETTKQQQPRSSGKEFDPLSSGRDDSRQPVPLDRGWCWLLKHVM